MHGLGWQWGKHGGEKANWPHSGVANGEDDHKQ